MAYKNNQSGITIGGYVAVAGGVLTAASQLTTTNDSE